jgi:hypothetical protein
MLNAKACFAALCIPTATTSHGHSLTGNDIRADCQVALSTYQEPTGPSSAYKLGVCFGFVIAILDLGSCADDPPRTHIPSLRVAADQPSIGSVWR